MWRGFVNGYRALEREQNAVLKDPAVLAGLPASWRTRSLDKLAAMSQIERDDLLAYSRKYPGRRAIVPVALTVAVLNVAAVMMYWAVPNTAPSVIPALVFATVMGVIGYYWWFALWYFYRSAVIYRMMPWLPVFAGAGFVAGVSVAAMHFGGRSWDSLDWDFFRPVIGRAFWAAALLMPIAVIVMVRNRRFAALSEKQGNAERNRLARELSESQLRLLRAQIEPHFLFNTLGAVQQLAEHAAPRAAELTANLITFLRSSFAEMRSESVTLGADFAMIEAYLNVMKTRLGERLAFTLTLPPALAGVPVPSLLLLTLVENVIKHGIEPSLRGGVVELSAEAHDGMLRLRVHDSGVGMDSVKAFGNGLENVRERISLTYPGNAAAGLALSSPEDGGVIAELTLPLPSGT